MSEEQEETGNAIRTSVSLPPYLHEWLKEVTKSKKIYPKYGKFASNSSVVVVALAELKGRIEAREEIEKEPIKKEVTEEQNVFDVLLKAYLQTEDGKKYLQNHLQNLKQKAERNTPINDSHFEYVE